MNNNTSDETFHEALELLLVDHAVTIVINLLEECIYNCGIKLLSEANLSKCCLCQWYHLFTVEEARVVLVVLGPEVVDDLGPFSVGLILFFFILVRLGIIFVLLVILSLLLLYRFDFLHLVLQICLLLFFHNLIHEHGLVDSLGRIKARCTLSVPLNLMLVAQGD